MSLLGPYRLLRVIGRGSLGVVHLALNTTTQQPVALKTLELGGDAADAQVEEAAARFIAEAELAKRLSHPDIVQVFGAGRSDARLWLAMELLGGCDLTRYTQPQRLLPEALVLHIGERLARALAHAHAQGVVHRDLKPGNVMVDLPAGRVKLTDFGIAGAADSARTRTGIVLGTPVYMAPEQLAGAAADARSDQYALGALLFHLLAGRLPHAHDSFGELLRRVAREPAPDLRTLRPQLPAALADLVARLLHKQPARRFTDANELADALEQVQSQLDGQAPSAPRHNHALAEAAHRVAASP